MKKSIFDWESILAAFSATMMLAADPVIVRLPPTVATNEMIAHAYLRAPSSRISTFGLANWTTATFPNNCDDINTNIEIPKTELKVLKGESPTILSHYWKYDNSSNN